MTQRIQPLELDTRDFRPQVFDIVLDATRPMTDREIQAQHEAAIPRDVQLSKLTFLVALVTVCGGVGAIVIAFLNGVLS